MPYKTIIHNAVTKLYSVRSVLYERRSLTPVLNEEMLDNFDTVLKGSPRKLALQCWLAKSTADVITKLRKLRSCKTTIVRSRFHLDCGARIQESVYSGPLTLNLGVHFTADT
jgi:hypothetical protein